MHRRRDDTARCEIGADIRGVVRPQCQETPVAVECQLGFADVVTIVVVSQHAFATLGDPFDWALDLARGPECQRIFGIMPALHAKAAADLTGDDAELGFGDVEDAASHVGPCGVRALGADIERETSEPIVPLADAAARLHRGGGDAIEAQASDVVSPGEGRLDCGLVANREEEDWLHEHDGVPRRLFEVLTRSVDRLWRWPDRP